MGESMKSAGNAPRKIKKFSQSDRIEKRRNAMPRFRYGFSHLPFGRPRQHLTVLGNRRLNGLWNDRSLAAPGR